MRIKLLIIISFFSFIFLSNVNAQREKYNFNSDWRYIISGQDSASFFSTPFEKKSDAVSVPFPRAFLEDEAFKLAFLVLSAPLCCYF